MLSIKNVLRSGTFCSYCICHRVDCGTTASTDVKGIRYPFTSVAVYYVKAVAPVIDSAPDVGYVGLSQAVWRLGPEEPATAADYVVLGLLRLDPFQSSEYPLDLLAVCRGGISYRYV
jgi:hypothetical protein